MYTYDTTDYLAAYVRAGEAAVSAWDAYDTPDAVAAAESALAAVRAALALPAIFLAQATVREIAAEAHSALLDLRAALDDAVTGGEPAAAAALVYAVYELSGFATRYASPVPVRVSTDGKRLVLA